MIKVYWLYHNELDNIYTDGYIGITKNIKIRFNSHRKRFGEFLYKIIYYGNIEQALYLENKLRPKPGIGWNEATGGRDGYKAGHSENSILKIKAIRANQSPPRKNVKNTELHNLRSSISQKGKPKSEAHIAAIKASKQNISDETRAKIAIASKRRKHTDEAKAKVSEALRKRIRTPETKEKLRLAALRQWERNRENLNVTNENTIRLNNNER